jgi:hypothetical protein
MQFRRSYLAFAVVLAPLAGMALVTACGGSDTGNDAGSDATTDVTTADVGLKDTAPANDASDASCANDVDLTQYLPSADAAIDVDAGGYNIAACTGCLKSDCASDINACNGDCACRQTVIDLVTCVGQGQETFQQCGETALIEGDQNTQSLLTCALGNCEAICIGSGDGGKTDAGDSGITDAADGG